MPHHLEKLKRTLEDQKELGAPYLHVFSFYIPQGRAPEDFGRRCWTGWSRMAEEAAAWDSVLLREREGASTGTAPPTLQREALEAFYGPTSRPCSALPTLSEVEQQTLPAYELLKPYVEYVHVRRTPSGARGPWCPPGRGTAM